MKLKRLEKRAIFDPDNVPFSQCHASTLVRTEEGELFLAFFAGTREGMPDMAIWLSAFMDGEWHPPRKIVDHEGIAQWNPVLHLEGDQLYLFYKVGETVHTWKTYWTTTRLPFDAWSNPEEVVAGDTLPRGPVKNKITVSSDGQWLAPSSKEEERHWDAFVDISKDKGKTWEARPIPIDHLESSDKQGGPIWSGLSEQALWETDLPTVFKWDGVIQPSIWESKPQTFHSLMRSTRGKVYRSDSFDGGQTWCKAYATALPNNNSGLDLCKCEDGLIALVYNPIEGNWGKRSPIALTLSDDNGDTWPAYAELEDAEGEYSYPAVISAGGELHISYTSNRRTIIYERWCIDVEE